MSNDYNLTQSPNSFSVNIISSSLDRPITTFTWAADNKHIYALVEDDRKQNIYSFDVHAKTNSLVTNAEAVFSDLSANDRGQMVVLYSDPHTPNEIYALDGETPRKVTKVHDEFLAGLKSIYVKGFGVYSYRAGFRNRLGN